MVGQYSTRTMESLGGSKQAGDVSYQINCQTTKKGKMIAGTKRRICWKFGFSNHDAVNRGLSGTDCRGEEHEVVFVWSWTSGKKFVLADGHEVHWSKQSLFAEKFDGSWQCSWQSQMAGAKRQLEVVAYTKKSNKNTSVADSSFRNFDLIIDGVPFSEMPQMFELGLTKTAEDQRRMRGGFDANNTQRQQQQELPQQRRKHIYDYEIDTVSQHSYSSQQQQYSTPATSRTSFSASDLLYSTTHHSRSSHLHQSLHDAPQNSFSASDLLDFHEQPQQQRQQQVPLAYCNELCSQSMPDLRYGLSTSPASVVVGVESVPHFDCQHAQFPQPNHQTSPTSVRASNPFDIYATATKSLQQPRQLQQHYIPVQFSNTNYAPYTQQNQQSTVY